MVARVALRSDVGTLIANWRAYDLDAQATGTAVTSWADRSGTPLTLTQPTTTNQPTLQKNVLNGRSVVRFDNVDDFLSRVHSSSLAQPWTVVVVMRSNTADGELFGSDDTTVELRIGSTNTRVLWAGTANLTAGVYVNSTWEVQIFHAEGATSSLTVNGATTAGTAGTSAIGTGWQVGRFGGATPAKYFDGDIAELLVYTGAWGVTQQAQIDTLLQDEYAITTTDYIPATTAQTVYPASDISTTGWVNTGGGASFAVALADGGTGNTDDTTYALSPALSGTPGVLEEKFGAVTIPTVKTGWSLDYRLIAINAATTSILVELVEGTTVRASETRTAIPTTWTTYSLALTSVQATAVTSGTDLRIRFTATGS